MNDQAEQSQASTPGLTLSGIWAIASVVLPVIAALKATVSTNDSAYGIRAGELMLRMHSILRADVFTLTVAGTPWLNQQWGAQVLFALVYRSGGWAALALLRAVLVGAIFLLVYLTCRARGATQKLAAWLTLTAFAVSAGGLALRPQLMGMALFALTAWLAFHPNRHPRRIWLVPLVAAIWANVHGSFFLAWVLVGVSWMFEREQRSPNRRRTSLVLLASVLATLANPFGVRIWTYVIDIATNSAITRLVSEWQPPTIRSLVGASFFASGVLVVGLIARRPDRASWPILVGLGLFFLIGLQAERGVFWWALAAPPLVVPLVKRRDAVSVERRTLLNTSFVVALAVLLVAFIPWFRNDPDAPSRDLVSNAPLGVTAKLRQVLGPGEGFFNPVPWASWFELALPGHPIFFDPRIELFPPGVIRDQLIVSNAQEGWQQVFRRWRIRVVVVDPAEEGALIPWISRDPDWQLAYRDDQAMLFIRR